MEMSLSDMKIIYQRRQRESTKCLNDIVLNSGIVAQCGKSKKYGFKFCYDCSMKELPNTCAEEGCKKRIGEKWKLCYEHNQNSFHRGRGVKGGETP
jgi:hypothetical protein